MDIIRDQFAEYQNFILFFGLGMKNIPRFAIESVRMNGAD